MNERRTPEQDNLSQWARREHDCPLGSLKDGIERIIKIESQLEAQKAMNKQITDILNEVKKGQTQIKIALACAGGGLSVIILALKVFM